MEHRPTKPYKHPWKARLVVALFMLIMSFAGLVFSDMKEDGAWLYWRIMAPCFAVVCLWLSWYLRRAGKPPLRSVTLWHEILHWLGLIVCVYLVSIFVQMGVMGKIDASLVVMTLLALATFIAGIYVDPAFIVIGVAIGLFAVSGALAIVYLYTLMLPITLLTAIILVIIIMKGRDKSDHDRLPPPDPLI